MTYTPRQAAAFLDLAARRKAQEAAAQLSITALATQGKAKDINKRIKELSK